MIKENRKKFFSRLPLLSLVSLKICTILTHAYIFISHTLLIGIYSKLLCCCCYLESNIAGVVIADDEKNIEVSITDVVYASVFLGLPF